MSIYLSNTLTKSKDLFEPIDKNNVRMYVCGPTVYSRAHIGNARAVVVFDLLYRLLKYKYHKVTYARNITDVDDKIIDTANKENISINEITTRTIQMFHEDMAKLNCLPPTFEPKATEYINQMHNLIQKLLDNGSAYIANDHILFSVDKCQNYGKLSKRNLGEMIAGSRVEVADYKNNPADFVLWKPAKNNEPGWESPWGIFGRPGWHIECSAMSNEILGQEFDIHGGGIDLIFPHHENEIAQSECAHPNTKFANYWLHNGFLTINGEKMAKSLNNFTTVKDLLDKDISGLAIRYVLLSSHYTKPLDFNHKILDDAKKFINQISIIYNYSSDDSYKKVKLEDNVISCLSDDLNIAKVFAIIHKLIQEFNKSTEDNKNKFRNKILSILSFLGFVNDDLIELSDINISSPEAEKLLQERNFARQNKDWQHADKIRDQLLDLGYIIEDTKNKSVLRKK